VQPSATQLSEAADWLMRLGAAPMAGALPDQSELRAWQRWHAASPGNRAAWQRVERLQSLLLQAPQESAQALKQARHQRQRRAALGQLGGLGALALAAGLPLWWPGLAPAPAPLAWWTTPPGQQRQRSLPDGSQLLLAADSRVGLRVHQGVGELHLAHGALRLETAPGTALRWRVQGRDGQVQPLGTRFTLEQRQAHSLLVVLEAAVLVRQGPDSPSRRVEAGQRLRFAAGHLDQPEPATWADTAWLQGVLAVVDMPLGQLLAELQRQGGWTVHSDPALLQRRVSGSFRLDDPEASLNSLATLLGLRSQRNDNGWHLTPP
jgi:transmembrane sensor